MYGTEASLLTSASSSTPTEQRPGFATEGREGDSLRGDRHLESSRKWAEGARAASIPAERVIDPDGPSPNVRTLRTFGYALLSCRADRSSF